MGDLGKTKEEGERAECGRQRETQEEEDMQAVKRQKRRLACEGKENERGAAGLGGRSVGGADSGGVDCRRDGMGGSREGLASKGWREADGGVSAGRTLCEHQRRRDRCQTCGGSQVVILAKERERGRARGL